MAGTTSRFPLSTQVKSNSREATMKTTGSYRRFMWRMGQVGVVGSVICLLIILPKVSFGQAWVVQPGLELEARYNDNLRLVEDDSPIGPQEVAQPSIASSLRISRVTDTASIAGLLRVDGTYYLGETERLGSDFQSNQLLDFSAFRRGELSQFGGSISVRRDTLLRTISPGGIQPTIPTGGSPIDVDDQLVGAENVRRLRLSIGPSWSRQLTERMQAGVAYDYSNVSLTNVPANLGALQGIRRLQDYQMHTIGAYSLTEVTQRDQFALVFKGRRYEADNDQRFNSYDLQGGIVHQFTETTRGILTLGGRYTTFSGPISNGNNTGFTATLGATKRTGLTIFAASLARVERPSISGNLVETDQFTLNVNRQLSERSRIILRSILFETEAIDDLASFSNRRYLRVGPVFRYALSPSWALEASYEYRREKRFFEAASADDNMVTLSLIYQRPTAVRPGRPTQGTSILGPLDIQ
jgi:hypothetical protein